LDRHGPERLDDLERAGDSGVGDPPRTGAGHVATVDLDRTRGGAQMAGDEVDQCGLTGAVGPDDAEQPPRHELEVDLADRVRPAKGLRQPAAPEHGAHGRYLRPWSSRENWRCRAASRR